MPSTLNSSVFPIKPQCNHWVRKLMLVHCHHLTFRPLLSFSNPIMSFRVKRTQSRMAKGHVAFCYHISWVSCSWEDFLGISNLSWPSHHRDSRSVILWMFFAGLSLLEKDVSSLWFNSDYASLAGISQKWCCGPLTAHHCVTHHFNSSHTGQLFPLWLLD